MVEKETVCVGEVTAMPCCADAAGTVVPDESVPAGESASMVQVPGARNVTVAELDPTSPPEVSGTRLHTVADAAATERTGVFPASPSLSTEAALTRYWFPTSAGLGGVVEKVTVWIGGLTVMVCDADAAGTVVPEESVPAGESASMVQVPGVRNVTVAELDPASPPEAPGTRLQTVADAGATESTGVFPANP